MAEEMESPTEQAEEDMHEHAHHAKESWVGWVALTAAFLAALAAITGLKAGDHANEALFEQVHATDKWNEYQAQKSKALAMTLGTANVNKILAALGKPLSEGDDAKLEEREKKQEALKEQATEMETSARDHMARHKTLAPGVTMFQIAIAMAAITVLSNRKPLWYVSLALGVVGIYFLAAGTVLMKHL